MIAEHIIKSFVPKAKTVVDIRKESDTVSLRLDFDINSLYSPGESYVTYGATVKEATAKLPDRPEGSIWYQRLIFLD